jgi:hypothetical protein
LTSQDEITRTANRLKDAFGAAADVMMTGNSPVRIQGPRTGHAWKWLLPLAAAASVVVIALAAVLAGHPAGNTLASGPFTQAYSSNGKAAHLVNVRHRTRRC